jgi:hypothetical protein
MRVTLDILKIVFEMGKTARGKRRQEMWLLRFFSPVLSLEPEATWLLPPTQELSDHL